MNPLLTVPVGSVMSAQRPALLSRPHNPGCPWMPSSPVPLRSWHGARPCELPSGPLEVATSRTIFKTGVVDMKRVIVIVTALLVLSCGCLDDDEEEETRQEDGGG